MHYLYLRERKRAVTIDETKTKIGKDHLYICAAVYVDSKEILAVRCLYTRSIMDVELIIKGVLKYCMNKPLILVDKGPWYKQVLDDLARI